MKNKKIGKILMIAIIMTLVTSLFVLPITADFTPQAADTYLGLIPSETSLNIGETFNVTFYVEPGSETLDSWKIYNLTYDYTGIGIINATEVTIGTWWASGGFSDPGTILNTAGCIINPQGFVGAGTTSNLTGAVINFSAVGVGVVYINLSSVRVERSGVSKTNTSLDTMVTIYPQGPTGLTATTYNYTIINITNMIRGTAGDNYVLCGKTGAYPSGPTDSELYNGTGTTFDHTSLNNCTAYYYRAWTYNATENMYSDDYQSAIAFTNCYTNFSFAGETPTNASTTTNCTYSVPVNVTVIHNAGYSFRYWINCSNGQTTSAIGVAANTSVGRTMTGLSHNTSYWWNITVVDSYGDSHDAKYTFTTGIGGGTNPTAGTPTPTSGGTGVIPFSTVFSVVVTDADLDPVNTTFYWANDTVIGYDDYTASAGTASITNSGNLALGTTYQWYVRVKDTAGCLATGTKYPTSGYYSFTTQASAGTITKEWDVTSTNMIVAWVNVTNNGAINLTNIQVNEVYGSNLAFGGASPANDSGEDRWTIPFLNYTGESKWYNITIYLNLSGRIPNGTSITNSVWSIVNETNITATATPLLFSHYATKQLHSTTIEWNATSMTYSINVTNNGDFYLNWVQINETYFDNTSFTGSSITPAIGNETFNLIAQLAPSATASMWISMAINSSAFVNGTYIWNNFTATTNETSTEVQRNHYNLLGALTEAVRITYISSLVEVSEFGDTVLGILGLLLVISAILLIVGIIYKQGLFGGGEGGE